MTDTSLVGRNLVVLVGAFGMFSLRIKRLQSKSDARNQPLIQGFCAVLLRAMMLLKKL
jgi:hypothetical protein